MLKWVLTGGLIPFFLLGGGIFFSLYLKGRPFSTPKKIWRAITAENSRDGVSPFRAVTLALAGTLGVGNIVGVANAIYLGGAGAIFWMWISALVAMVLKYAEIVLALSHRRNGRNGFFGGAYYYIKDCFASRGHVFLGALLSGLFAVFMIVDALGMGCMIQVNAVSMAFRGVLHIPTWVIVLLLLILTVPVIVRGAQSVSALTELLVPIMTAGYVILSVTVLVIKRDALGSAFSAIFQGAFTAEGVGGGIVGFLSSRALRTGTMRGLLSNEAGCGTAPTAHAQANTDSPAMQGVWGIFEVFVDTILLCTATALVLLVSFPEVEMLGYDSVMMAIRAYSCVLGGWSEWFFCAAIFCFAYATLLCWASYGLESLQFLSRKPIWRYLYFFSFGLCMALGAIAAPDAVWNVTDFAITVLTTVNLITLLLARREIKRETELL